MNMIMPMKSGVQVTRLNIHILVALMTLVCEFQGLLWLGVFLNY